jgi:uncharacterized protein YndB with AHSA1/START domain
VSAPEFAITRTVRAPRAVVWRCLGERDRFMPWWGPASHATSALRFEFRPGGVCHYSMSAGGEAMWGRILYLEIEAPSRLVFLNAFSDAGGALHRAPWEPRWPLEMHNTLTLAGSGAETTAQLVVRPVGDDEAEAAVFREGFADMEVGFGQSFDQLAALLEKDLP